MPDLVQTRFNQGFAWICGGMEILEKFPLRHPSSSTTLVNREWKMGPLNSYWMALTNLTGDIVDGKSRNFGIYGMRAKTFDHTATTFNITSTFGLAKNHIEFGEQRFIFYLCQVWSLFTFWFKVNSSTTKTLVGGPPFSLQILSKMWYSESTKKGRPTPTLKTRMSPRLFNPLTINLKVEQPFQFSTLRK